MAKRQAVLTSGPIGVAVYQFGQEVIGAVNRGIDFELRGSGFAPSNSVPTSQAKICLTGQVCVRTPVADDGSFTQTFTLNYPGTYFLHVYQGASAGDPNLVFAGTLTVD